MWKRVVTLLLVVVTLLSFTACGEGLPPAQEIIDGVIESAGDIESHKFDIDMTMEATGEEEGEAVEMVMTLGFSGAVDFENKELSTEISISMEMTGEEDVEMAMEMYLVDGMGYVMMDMPEMDPMWMKEEVADEDWEEVNQMLIPVDSHLELLEEADVTVIGSERVEGVDCYVLELTPNLEQLWDTAMQQTEVVDMGISAIAEEVLQEAFTSFSVKQWIAKDTYFLTKSEIIISMEITPELMDIMGDDSLATMDITVTLLSYDHNQPISIVLPQEALEATEGSDDFADEEEARRTEYHNVQSAIIALMIDNGLAEIPNPVDYAGGVATDDMTAFPDSITTAADKDYAGVGTPKAGYVLYAHDLIGADTSTFETVNYVTMDWTIYYYTCESDGTVRQFDGADIATATEYSY